MPETLTQQEIREMSLTEKRDLIIATIQADQMSELDYDRLIVMLGLLKSSPADETLDLEEHPLDDIAVGLANHIEPDQLAGVLSALRDCEDDSRRNGIIDRMIKKAFQQSHESQMTEEDWRLKVERKLPER